MAKKALVNISRRQTRFAVRAYTRCSKCGCPRAATASSLCRTVSEMRRTGELPGGRRAAGNGTRGLEHK